MNAARLVALLLVLLPGLPGVARAEDAAHRALAEHYAPVIFQESRSAVLDFITRFDYDGDWRGDNNWRNAYLHDLPGYAYYSVIESTRHYFITYAFYHARDYTAKPYEGFAPKAEHENDMEGCTLTVEKDGSPFGKVILLETLAHDVFYKYNNRSVRRVSNGALKLDGSLTLVDDRPAVYIEPEGHGVKAASAGMVRGSESFPGLIYRYTGTASVPQGPHDHRATYDLLSIEDTLWAHRFDVGSTFCCADAYAMPGGTSATLGSAFNGPIGGCAAKPPWGWDQATDKIVKGDWFRDPLTAYATQLRIEDFSGTYTRNPYLEHDGRTAAPACAASTTSTTVRGALTSSLLGIGRAITANGIDGAQISQRANQLFVDSAVLLEWAQRAELERWSWDTSRPAQPSFVDEGIRTELRVPQVAGFSFVSPEVKAPARYFDSVILKYRTPLEGLRARVSWVYDGMTDFSDEMTFVTPIEKAEGGRVTQISLADSPKWDKEKTVLRMRIAIESAATGVVATGTPAGVSDSGQFAISYLVFDRDAFSNTFAR
jgi:hypothetical protein